MHPNPCWTSALPHPSAAGPFRSAAAAADADAPWRSAFRPDPSWASAADGTALRALVCDAGSPASRAAAPLLVCLHGAGCAALSWAPLARELPSALPAFTLAALDLRGHGGSDDGPRGGAGAAGEDGGNSAQSSSARPDLSVGVLLDDVVAATLQLVAQTQRERRAAAHGVSGDGSLAEETTQPPPPLRVFLVGHSLGGALAAKASATLALRLPSCGAALCGVVLLDVVEGTARGLHARRAASAALASRPASFVSLEAASKWERLRSGSGGPGCGTHRRAPSVASRSVASQLVWRQNGGVVNSRSGADGDDSGSAFVWRTDLAASSESWDGWFEGMGDAFLSAPCGRLLLLASTDRLDSQLTTAQMRGALQVVVLREGDASHSLHEDAPGVVAASVASFVSRNSRALPPARGIRAAPLPQPQPSVAALPVT